MSDISIGLGGILAAGQAISTIGSNIANAGNATYARRDVKLSGQSWEHVGGANSSVSVDSVIRVKDMFLSSRLQSHIASLASADVRNTYFAEIEGVLQEPGENGIGAALDQFFNQWETLALRPEDPAVRSVLVLNASSLAEKMSSLRAELIGIREAAQVEVCHLVEEVNSLAQRLTEVNRQIVLEPPDSANPPLALEDERDRLVGELAELIGASNLSPNELTARVTIGSVLLVDGDQYIPLRPPIDYNAPIAADFSGDPVPVLPESGKLAGLLEISREAIPEYLSKLDELAGLLIRAVNTVHAQGIGQSGRFTEMTANYAVSDVDGDGDSSNDMLANAGLPFVPGAGALTMNVVDQTTGAVTTHTINVDPATQSLADIVGAIDALPNVNAAIQNGKLRIVAAGGYEFDFAVDQGTDILGALGVNAFFTGKDAESIGIVEALIDHPERVAAGLTSNSGDGDNAIALSNLRYLKVDENGTMTLPDFWRNFVTEVGSNAANVKVTTSSLKSVVELLEKRENSISGVSLDEEATKLLEYQQMYQSCARYIALVSQLSDALLQIV